VSTPAASDSTTIPAMTVSAEAAERRRRAGLTRLSPSGRPQRTGSGSVFWLRSGCALPAGRPPDPRSALPAGRPPDPRSALPAGRPPDPAVHSPRTTPGPLRSSAYPYAPKGNAACPLRVGKERACLPALIPHISRSRTLPDLTGSVCQHGVLSARVLSARGFVSTGFVSTGFCQHGVCQHGALLSQAVAVIAARSRTGGGKEAGAGWAAAARAAAGRARAGHAGRAGAAAGE